MAFNSLTDSILKKIDNGEISELTAGVKVPDDLKIDPLGVSSSKK